MGDFVVCDFSSQTLSLEEYTMFLSFYDTMNDEMHCQLKSIDSEERRKSYHMEL